MNPYSVSSAFVTALSIVGYFAILGVIACLYPTWACYRTIAQHSSSTMSALRVATLVMCSSFVTTMSLLFIIAIPTVYIVTIAGRSTYTPNYAGVLAFAVLGPTFCWLMWASFGRIPRKLLPSVNDLDVDFVRLRKKVLPGFVVVVVLYVMFVFVVSSAIEFSSKRLSMVVPCRRVTIAWSASQA